MGEREGGAYLERCVAENGKWVALAGVIGGGWKSHASAFVRRIRTTWLFQPICQLALAAFRFCAAESRTPPQNSPVYIFAKSVEMLSMSMFNIDNGYLEAIVRGYHGALLTKVDYNNLMQCERLDGTPSPLSPSPLSPSPFPPPLLSLSSSSSPPPPTPFHTDKSTQT